jgi:putative copper export protein
MVVIAFIRLRVIRKLEAAAAMNRKKVSLVLMHVNALIGVVILFLSAVLTIL